MFVNIAQEWLILQVINQGTTPAPPPTESLRIVDEALQEPRIIDEGTQETRVT